MSATINIGISFTVLTSLDMFALHPALSDLGLTFFQSLPLFISLLSWQLFQKLLVIHKLCQAGASLLPLFLFFFFLHYHRGFTSVRRRFGDERDGIIPIPALPLSRSNSLTKLSDSILDPTARINLLCHLQSTRGSAKSDCSCVRTLLLSKQCLFSLYFICLLPFLSVFSLSPSLLNILWYSLRWKHLRTS